MNRTTDSLGNNMPRWSLGHSSPNLTQLRGEGLLIVREGLGNICQMVLLKYSLLMAKYLKTKRMVCGLSPIEKENVANITRRQRKGGDYSL